LAFGEGPGLSAVMVVQVNAVARKVAELIEPHIERQGFELIGVEFRRGTRQSLLRLLVDRPAGGISLDDLEQLSPLVGDLLDVYDPIEGRYTLEMASPGINRPLMRLKDFKEYVGRRIKVRTREAHAGRKNFIGVLASVTAEGIELDDDVSGAREVIGFGEIQGANYEHQFD
jgi:ribosome maturation factor RimP